MTDDMKVRLRTDILSAIMQRLTEASPPAQDWAAWMVTANIVPARLQAYMVSVDMPASLRDLDADARTKIYDNPQLYGDAVREYEASRQQPTQKEQ